MTENKAKKSPAADLLPTVEAENRQPDEWAELFADEVPSDPAMTVGEELSDEAWASLADMAEAFGPNAGSLSFDEAEGVSEPMSGNVGLSVTDTAALEPEAEGDGAEYVEAFAVGEHPSQDLLRPTLLEASAGTGKTFSIKHLVLRLIVEHNKAIDKILVVTFTRAATAELSTRIREHLADTVRYVDACRRLWEECRAEADEESLETLLSEIARDPVAFAEKRGLETAGVAAAVKGTDGLIVDQVLHWIGMTTVSEKEEAEKPVMLDFDVQLTRLRRALSNFDNAAIYTIHSFCKQMLDKHAFSASGALDWELTPDDGDYRRQVIGDFLRDELNLHMDDAEFRQNLVKEIDWDVILREVVKVPEELAERKLLRDGFLQAERLRFIEEAPARLEKMKAEAGIAVYDDLLIMMWRTIQAEISNKSSDRAFVKSVRSAYQAVLIDEFQDTDPVQYEVFKALFLPANPDEWKNGTLFFVGDPKQAIYSFRSADLNTYFRAKEDLKARHGRNRAVIANLPKNYRSSPELVAAVNALFSYPESRPAKNAFLHDDLAFKPVGSKSGNTGLFLWKEGAWQAMEPFDLRWRHDFASSAAGIEAEIEAVAADMVNLIRGGQEGRVALRAESFEQGKGLPQGRDTVRLVLPEGTKEIPLRALEPRDIAILSRQVRNNGDIAALRRKLDQHGIRTRLLDDSHICETPEAEELLAVLYAYASPDDERVVRAARATRLMGETLDDLERDDEVRRTDIRLLLEEGRRQWTRRGLAPVLGELMTRCRTAERLLPVKGGEQALTNFSHLIEILHEVGKKYNAPSGLIAWFEAAIRNPSGSGDDRWQVRLASDANLVTIWTIHKSKGLQYPVVYLPFVKNLRERKSDAVVQRVHDDKGKMLLQIGTKKGKDGELPEHQIEGAQENIRLAYVALTRAACRIMMTVSYPETFSGKTALPEQCAYWQLLMGASGSAVSANTVLARLQEMAEKGILRLERLGDNTDLDGNPIGEDLPIVAAAAEALVPQAGESRPVRPVWRHSSFTGIARMISDDGEEHPVFGARYVPDLARETPDMLDFPRGTQAGDTLHRILEVADFNEFHKPEKEADRTRLAENIIRSHMTAFPSEKEAGNAAKVAGQMIDDVLNAEILPTVYLRDIKPQARVAEMEFLLSMPEGLTAKRMGEWLQRTNPEYAVPGLDDKTLSGYLTGFIDLAFMDRNRRFWVLDWKSNAIAEYVKTPEDYTREVMAGEMTKHHYRLQYLIYLVALRRFLKHRLGDAFTDDVIGGAVYIFLRGVRKNAKRRSDGSLQGVTVDRVDPKVLADLDTLFSDNWKSLFGDETC